MANPIVQDTMTQIALRQIWRRDPSGGDVAATQSELIAHRAWSIARYGREIWNRYVAAHRAGSEGMPDFGERASDWV